MRQFRNVLSILTAASLLAACNVAGPNKGANALLQPSSTSPVPSFAEKTTKYQQDTTTEVLIDTEIKQSEIKKVVKHGDHWHVFTKDGRERITYTDPTAKQAPKLDFVSVVSLAQLKKLAIVEIKQHGDHYHCYTADGTEYITYENPASVFPKLKIGKYVGSHGQHKHGKQQGKNNKQAGQGTAADPLQAGKQGKRKPSSDNQDPNEVVTILQHGDHWHVYTRDGREYITYSDPSSMYPNARVGIYEGSHGPIGGGSSTKPHKPNQSGNQGKPDSSKPNKPVQPGNHDSSSPSGGSSKPNLPNGFVQTVKPAELSGKNIKKILQHEDHWHCYDANGKEYVVMGGTKEELQKYCPDAEFGQYVGKHGDQQQGIDPEMDKLLKAEASKKQDDPTRIVKLSKHGNHWHYWRANGEAGIFYVDPAPYFPDLKMGDYDEDMKQKQTIDEDDLDNNMYSKMEFLKKHYGLTDDKIKFIEKDFYIEDQCGNTHKVNWYDLEVLNGKVEISKDKKLPEITQECKKESAASTENKPEAAQPVEAEPAADVDPAMSQPASSETAAETATMPETSTAAETAATPETATTKPAAQAEKPEAAAPAAKKAEAETEAKAETTGEATTKAEPTSETETAKQPTASELLATK